MSILLCLNRRIHIHKTSWFSLELLSTEEVIPFLRAGAPKTKLYDLHCILYVLYQLHVIAKIFDINKTRPTPRGMMEKIDSVEPTLSVLFYCKDKKPNKLLIADNASSECPTVILLCTKNYILYDSSTSSGMPAKAASELDNNYGST